MGWSVSRSVGASTYPLSVRAPYSSIVLERCHTVPLMRERIFIELMTSDRELKASREGSK